MIQTSVSAILTTTLFGTTRCLVAFFPLFYKTEKADILAIYA